MSAEIDVDEAAAQSAVSTGHLPSEQEVAALTNEAYRR